MEFGCAGVASCGKTQAILATPTLMISTSYNLQANGSFDGLPERLLKKLKES